MISLEARAQAAMAPAAVRYSGARLAALFLGAILGAAALMFQFVHAPPGADVSAPKALLAAAVCSGWAGWRLVGLGLGRGPRAAGMRGLLAAGAATAAFLLAAAIADTADSLSNLRFGGATELALHVVERAVAMGAPLIGSPALALIAAFGMGAALAAEALFLAWRWDGATDARSAPAAHSRPPH